MDRNIVNIKRQRTGSRSPTPPVELLEAPSQEESEDETSTRNGAKKLRNGRSHHKAVPTEKERLKQEAANKRKVRAERRRGDGTFPLWEADDECNAY
jgi:hypothetical protein